MDETLLCGIPCSLMFGNERCERRENHVAKDLDSAFRRFCILFPQLVAAGITYRQGRCGFALYFHTLRWLYLPVDGWCMDEPTT